MKITRMLFALLFTATIGCASFEVISDYRDDEDFSVLKTFAWLQASKSENVMQINVERVKNAVDTKLKEKGFRLTEDGPDFLIALYGGREHKIDVTTFWEGYMEGEEEQIRNYEEGLIILDFLDSKSKKKIWRGEARGEFSPEWSQEKQKKIINEAVDKLLKNFPPGQ